MITLNNSDSPVNQDRNIAVKATSLNKHLLIHKNKRISILSQVNLIINSGESVAIVGTSGSGKSTLLSILAGLDLPSDGEVHLAGKRIDTMDEDSRACIRAEHIGFVFQSFQLLPNLTALENVILSLELNQSKQLNNSAINQKGLSLLKRVGLEHRTEHYPNQLSGGEQQRVAIARAFACEPKILFADEPTGNLDEKTSNTIIQLLFSMNKEEKTTLILVTHDYQLANRCERILELTNNMLIEKASTGK